MAANRATHDLEFDRAAAIDQAGRDLLEAVRTSVSCRVINCPELRNDGKTMLSAVPKDGVALRVRPRVTLRTNLDQLTGARSLPLTTPDEGHRPSAPPAVSPPAAESPPVPQERGVPRIEIDDSCVATCYANVFRIASTPEELIIDIGLNVQPIGGATQSVVVAQRIVMNAFTAKRLVQALELLIQRHEAQFGALETDVQKRAQHW